MTTEQAQQIVDQWHRKLDERTANARETGLPRDYQGRLFPSIHEAPDYWQARHVLGTITDEEFAEIQSGQAR